MTLQVLAEAEAELQDARIEPGLGLRLKDEARWLFQWISQNPTVPRVRPKGYRRVNFKVFPYYVAYFVWADTLWVLAVAHGRRRPDYWIGRKSKIM